MAVSSALATAPSKKGNKKNKKMKQQQQQKGATKLTCRLCGNSMVSVARCEGGPVNRAHRARMSYLLRAHPRFFELGVTYDFGQIRTRTPLRWTLVFKGSSEPFDHLSLLFELVRGFPSIVIYIDLINLRIFRVYRTASQNLPR